MEDNVRTTVVQSHMDKTIKVQSVKVWTVGKDTKQQQQRNKEGKYIEAGNVKRVRKVWENPTEFFSQFVQQHKGFSPCYLCLPAQSRWPHTECHCWGWTWPPGVVCSWCWLLHCLGSGTTAIRQSLHGEGHTTGWKATYQDASKRWRHHTAHLCLVSLVRHCNILPECSLPSMSMWWWW